MRERSAPESLIKRRVVRCLGMNTTTLDSGVRRHFALPVAIVLGAYAVLFLGFIKNPPLSLPRAVSFEPPAQQIELPPPEVPVVPNSDQDNGGPSQSRLPEISNPVSLEPLDRLIVSTIPMLPGALGVSLIVSPWSPGNSTRPGVGSGGSPMTVESLDRPPQAVAQPQPIYPSDARIKDQSGQVVVEFVVDQSGRVLDPRVVSSSDSIFEEPTLRAIEHWRFAPGTWHGVPVRFSMRVPVTFRLDE